MTPRSRRSLGPFLLQLVLGCALAATAARAAPLDDMVAFDALYIPALSATSAAAADPQRAAAAKAAVQRLLAAWPAQRARLAATWSPRRANSEWTAALAQSARQIEQAAAASAGDRQAAAHEALEPVRIELMKARHAMGFDDYFVDRLTAFHEPMEVLALAGATLKPEQLDAARRTELEQAFARARALWRAIELTRVDAAAYGLIAAREAQLARGLAEESTALERLSQALRGGDAAAVLAAARAIKPPFARVFTVFGNP